MNGRQIVFDDTVPVSPIVALGYSPRGALPDYFARIETLLNAGIEHRRHGAAPSCFLGVLAGWFDAFHEPALNIWDVAAGLLIVEEAGGVVRHDPLSDFLVRPSDVLARNRGFPGLKTVLNSTQFA